MGNSITVAKEKPVKSYLAWQTATSVMPYMNDIKEIRWAALLETVPEECPSCFCLQRNGYTLFTCYIFIISPVGLTRIESLWPRKRWNDLTAWATRPHKLKLWPRDCGEKARTTLIIMWAQFMRWEHILKEDWIVRILKHVPKTDSTFSIGIKNCGHKKVSRIITTIQTGTITSQLSVPERKASY